MTTMTDTKIKLRSRFSNHKVELVAPVMQYLPNGGHVIVQQAKTIRFNNGTAEVDEETFELLKENRAFTGSSSGPRSVWVESDPNAPVESQGPRVIDGAMSASTSRLANAPTPEWDTATPASLRKLIAEGKVNPMSALDYEMGSGRRALVIAALAEAIASTEQGDEQPQEAPKRRGRPPKAEVEPLEDVAVPLPDDGKVT